MSSKSSAPAAPDYTGAAKATAAGDLASAQAAINANRINQYGPNGSVTYQHAPTYTTDPATGKQVLDNNLGWSQTTTLSPTQQAIQDQTNQLNTGLLGTANSGLQYANDQLSHPGVSGWDVQKPGDFSQGNPATGFNPGQSYQDAMMSRLQPQIDRENQASDAQLANQGIAPGTQAYNNAKTVLSQQHNDLLNNATVQGLSAGLQANQQAFGQNQAQYQANLGATQQGFQQAAYNQMQPINVINALRSGTQVQSPSFNAVPQQQTTAGANLLGAAQNTGQYNMQAYQQNSANDNAFMNGLTSLGSAAIIGKR